MFSLHINQFPANNFTPRFLKWMLEKSFKIMSISRPESPYIISYGLDKAIWNKKLPFVVDKDTCHVYLRGRSTMNNSRCKQYFKVCSNFLLHYSLTTFVCNVEVISHYCMFTTWIASLVKLLHNYMINSTGYYEKSFLKLCRILWPTL